MLIVLQPRLVSTLWIFEGARSGILKATPIFLCKERRKIMFISNLSKENLISLIFDRTQNIFEDSKESIPNCIYCLEKPESYSSAPYSIEYIARIASGILIISEPLTIDINELQGAVDDEDMMAITHEYQAIHENAKHLLSTENRKYNTSVKLSSSQGILRLHFFLENKVPETELIRAIQCILGVLKQMYQQESCGW